MGQELNTLLNLFTDAGFLTGAAAGLLILGALFVLQSALSGSSRLWGLALTGATVSVLVLRDHLPSEVLIHFSVLAAAGWLVGRSDTEHADQRARIPRPWAWTVAAGAVLLFTESLFQGPTWVAFAAPVAVGSIGLAMSRSSLGSMRKLTGPLFLLTAFGIWATVPETDMARVLVGAAVPMAVATLTPIRARISEAGALAIAGLIVWLSVEAGISRPGSIIGSWGSIGLFALVPLAYWIRPWALVLGQAAIVFVASRLIGFLDSALSAFILMGLLYGATVAVLLLARSFSDEAPVDAHGQADGDRNTPSWVP